MPNLSMPLNKEAFRPFLHSPRV